MVAGRRSQRLDIRHNLLVCFGLDDRCQIGVSLLAENPDETCKRRVVVQELLATASCSTELGYSGTVKRSPCGLTHTLGTRATGMVLPRARGQKPIPTHSRACVGCDVVVYTAV